MFFLLVKLYGNNGSDYRDRDNKSDNDSDSLYVFVI